MKKLDIRHSGAPLGHEILGVNLSNDLDDDTFKSIDGLYNEFGVVIIRDQDLSPDKQVSFSRRFGDLEIFPFAQFNLPEAQEVLVISNIIEDGKPVGMMDAGRYWHTDMWYIDKPPRGSILYALEVPQRDGQVFGDTCFSSLTAAYDALDESMKKKLDGRKATFSYQKYLRTNGERVAKSGNKQSAQKDRESKSYPDIDHPIVKTHPVTGRKGLYLAEGVISRIEGYGEAESEAIVAELEEHVRQPEFVYRHKWRVGDVVMWDNRSCLHYATGGFALPLRRRMHRTTLA